MAELFHAEVMRGVYLISNTSLSPTGDKYSLAPGTATNNSYLVVGGQEAALIDLTYEEPGLMEYAEKLAGKPVRLLLTHGHPDHVYHLEDVKEVFMHPADEYIYKDGVLGWPVIDPSPRVSPLHEGDVIDLGGRIIEVFHVPGHTPGSLLFRVPDCGLLLSGDTVARRLLYGLHEFVPTDEFCGSLRRIQALDFDVIYSAHDRCALPRSYIEFMIERIERDLPCAERTYGAAEGCEMKWLVYGDVYTLRFFDMSYPMKYNHLLPAE